MNQNKISEKGFSLIELLATFFLISIVFGIASFFVKNLILDSRNKEKNLTITNIENVASLYTEEYPQNIIWQKETDNLDYSCVSVYDLVQKGYLKQSVLSLHPTLNYVVLKRDRNKNIILKEIDSTNICQNTKKIVPIPTSKEYCHNLTYNGLNQQLIKVPTHNDFSFDNTTITGKNAGSYSVIANLKEGNIWSDSSTTPKKFTCSIKKAQPIISLSSTTPTNTEIKINDILTTNFTSNIKGIVTLKSSNPTFAQASITNREINANQQMPIQIHILSTRNTNTYITITFTPKDTQNYYSASELYTIGSIEQKGIPIPKKEDFCRKPTPIYNQSIQKIINNPGEGYTFSSLEGKDAGEYKIIAKLKYGYKWNDGSLTPKEIVCKINKAIPTLTVTPTSGKVRKTEEFNITVTPGVNGKITTTTPNSNYIKVTSPSPIDIFAGNTTKITLTAMEVIDSIQLIVTLSPTDQKNYLTNSIPVILKVTPNTFKVTYVPGGNPCAPPSKIVTYNKPYGNLCNPSRTGYTFVDWYTASSGGDKVTKDTIVLIEKDHSITARWKANTYIVNYDGNGATKGSTADSTYTYDQLQKLTANGYIRNYTVSFDGNGGSVDKNSETSAYLFNGWATSKTGNKQYNDQQEVKIQNLNPNLDPKTTLYASWTATSINLATATKTGYTTTGWYTATSGGTKIGDANASYSPSANIELHAQWKAESYTLSYDSTGGTDCNAISVTYDSEYGTLCEPTKKGYIFAGWFTDKTNGSKIESTTKVTTASNHIIYAHWTAKKIKVTFIQNHNSTDNTSKTQEFTYGVANQKFNSAFTRDGYTQIGWSKDRNATDRTYTTASGVNDEWINNNYPSVTLYAIWKDDQPPKCGTVFVVNSSGAHSSYTWANWNRKMRVNCSDAGVGCKSSYFEKDFTTDTKDGIITIEDTNGNKTDCKIPVLIDKTPPTIKVTAYKRKSGGGKIGDAIGTATNKTLTLGWLGKDYPDGVYYEFDVTETGSGEKVKTWKYNVSGLSEADAKAKGWEDAGEETGISKHRLSAAGYRKAQYIVEDNAGNTRTIDIVLKLSFATPIISYTITSGKDLGNDIYGTPVKVSATCNPGISGIKETTIKVQYHTKITSSSNIVADNEAITGAHSTALSIVATCTNQAGKTESVTKNIKTKKYGEDASCGTYQCSPYSCNCNKFAEVHSNSNCGCPTSECGSLGGYCTGGDSPGSGCAKTLWCYKQTCDTCYKTCTNSCWHY